MKMNKIIKNKNKLIMSFHIFYFQFESKQFFVKFKFALNNYSLS